MNPKIQQNFSEKLRLSNLGLLESLDQEILSHINTLNLSYYHQLESEIQKMGKNAQDTFKQEALTCLKKSTEIARAPNLYERMILEVESAMANNLANFQNSLNAIIFELKLNSHMNPVEKIFLIIEGLLFSLFVDKDSRGNYEPLLVALGLIIPLIAIGTIFNSKRNLTNKST